MDLFIALLNADPDGRVQEPTDAEREAFREYVIVTHGANVWSAYNRSPWHSEMYA